MEGLGRRACQEATFRDLYRSVSRYRPSPPPGRGPNHKIVVPSHPSLRRINTEGTQARRPWQAVDQKGKTGFAPVSLACMASFWHIAPREEEHPMNEQQKEAWSGVLLTVLLVGILLGGLLVLRLTGN